jgi:hypothetical protein
MLWGLPAPIAHLLARDGSISFRQTPIGGTAEVRKSSFFVEMMVGATAIEPVTPPV